VCIVILSQVVKVKQSRIGIQIVDLKLDLWLNILTIVFQ